MQLLGKTLRVSELLVVWSLLPAQPHHPAPAYTCITSVPTNRSREGCQRQAVSSRAGARPPVRHFRTHPLPCGGWSLLSMPPRFPFPTCLPSPSFSPQLKTTLDAAAPSRPAQIFLGTSVPFSWSLRPGIHTDFSLCIISPSLSLALYPQPLT